ncbi:MAG: heavy metal translocating P-type ATPase metal-binding domain-containing protein [Verrucomicrobiae bacterium]|nr:heavy metal translocating P-type ATPase metal-binding domain-containing protein [Verrucomicrobiae bacterium]
MSEKTQDTQTTSAAATRAAGGCFHCGEPCPDDSFALAGRSFCCFGCQTVFSLLQENGLEQFYALNSAPGTRIRTVSAAARWAFLDDPAVAEQLLDFADQTRARVTLHLPAIHCVACVWLLENLFKLHPGIGKVLVNFSRREAAITFAPAQIKFSELAALLAAIGYEPLLTLGETGKAKPASAARKNWLQIGIAAFGFGNIMLMSLPFYFGLDSFNGPWFKWLAGWLSLAMTLPVVVFSAGDFWRAAWFSLRQRAITLEVPIVMGLAAIYLTSVWQVVSHQGPGYCDSLCGLIFFLLCGRLFQKKTYDRLTFDRDYQGFFPLSVVRKTPAGEECVAISRLQVGDRIILRNGELLPADGRLVGGEACIDYSFVTGESEPVACAAGQHLYAGGRQVGGMIEVATVKPVAQSYLATLWNHEAFRKNRDNDLDSLTNRYSRRFTRLVIGVALAAGVFWMFRDAGKALKVFTSVLIVACPCALALAAPLTHGTAQRILARLKIFLKNALVVERMAEVDTIVLDKTGTLTTADARGVQFIGSGKISAAQAGWIGSLARDSTHPNSVRITKSLSFAPLPVTGFRETPGAGIEGEVSGHKILLGSRTWVAGRAGIAEPGSRAACVRSSAAGTGLAATRGGATANPLRAEAAGDAAGSVWVAMDGEICGAFALQNTLRPEVAELIAQLGGRFELALLSGDNEREAARFQKLFGDRAVLKFNQSPADKLNFIRELQQRGRKVMMVGDGLNDAGALRQADVGVAVVEQIGVFSPASDVILDAAELPRLARVLAFSRRAARVVRTGFVISALYNLAGVSIAAAGFLSPIVCAILMPVSSVSVVIFACGATTWAARRGGLRPHPEPALAA